MTVQQSRWREEILEKAQKRFEDVVIKETLADLEQVGMQLRDMEKNVDAKLGALGVEAVAAEVEKVELMQEKLKTLQDIGRKNLRKQIAGELGVEIDSRSGNIVFTARKQAG